MLLTYERGTHDCIRGQPFRGLPLADGVLERLTVAQKQMRDIVWGEVCQLMQVWYHKLVRECESSDDDRVLDANTKHMCNLHAHLLLMLRNASVRRADRKVTRPLTPPLADMSAPPCWHATLRELNLKLNH